jgi:hypothetical protein
LTGIRILYDVTMGLNKLKEHLNYDAETGHFTWIKKGIGIKLGGRAGSLNKTYGYRIIGFENTQYREHRLAFYYMTGHFPKGHLDHKDRVRDNNKWSNLRECTQSQNMINSLKAKNKSGATGVSWDKTREKWLAQIRINCKKKNLGRFDKKEDAISAWESMAKSLPDNEFRISCQN